MLFFLIDKLRGGPPENSKLLFRPVDTGVNGVYLQYLASKVILAGSLTLKAFSRFYMSIYYFSRISGVPPSFNVDGQFEDIFCGFDIGDEFIDLVYTNLTTLGCIF